MKCKKCGCDALIKKDDWYECVGCGAILFDTEVKINDVKNPTKEVERIDSDAPEDKADIVTYTIDTEADGTVPASSTSEADPSENQDNPNEDEQNSTDEKKQKSKLRETIDFFIPVVSAVIVAIILKTLIFAVAVVPTGSMLNTIEEGDKILASRLTYISNDPERYDIVIFRYPDNEEQYFVKRIIGLPGETVQVINGIVYVTRTDGETIQLDDSFVTNCKPEGDFGPYEVPADSYFMMGDNRNTSWDSRYWDHKFVHKSKIIGKVKFKFSPEFSKIE
ncbi:MAG: signal peptidase I [Clostridium sp.]|nr:signal peptidase I [Clostridium sp.]